MGLGLGPEAQAWRLAGLQAWMVGACGCVHGPLRGAHGQAQGRGSPAARIEWPNWTAEWKVWRWGGPGSAPDLFPPEGGDPSCSNLTTALRDVPSLSSKPASPFMLGRLVRKLGLATSGDRLNVWGSLSHCHLSCNVGSTGKLTAPANQTAPVAWAGSFCPHAH